MFGLRLVNINHITAWVFRGPCDCSEWDYFLYLAANENWRKTDGRWKCIFSSWKKVFQAGVLSQSSHSKRLSVLYFSPSSSSFSFLCSVVFVFLFFCKSMYLPVMGEGFFYYVDLWLLRFTPKIRNCDLTKKRWFVFLK